MIRIRTGIATKDKRSMRIAKTKVAWSVPTWSRHVPLIVSLLAIIKKLSNWLRPFLINNGSGRLMSILIQRDGTVPCHVETTIAFTRVVISGSTNNPRFALESTFAYRPVAAGWWRRERAYGKGEFEWPIKGKSTCQKAGGSTWAGEAGPWDRSHSIPHPRPIIIVIIILSPATWFASSHVVMTALWRHVSLSNFSCWHDMRLGVPNPRGWYRYQPSDQSDLIGQPRNFWFENRGLPIRILLRIGVPHSSMIQTKSVNKLFIFFW